MIKVYLGDAGADDELRAVEARTIEREHGRVFGGDARARRVRDGVLFAVDFVAAVPFVVHVVEGLRVCERLEGRESVCEVAAVDIPEKGIAVGLVF